MITHISIKNFAIIKDLDLDLNPGLNIITGETGAGKSIIIEAVSMALGSRADADYIRTGEDKAQISLVIEKDGQEYILSREISASGKNLCKINGELVTLSELSALCKGLADIHGQYDHQSLLNPDNHTGVLDSFGGEEIAKVLQITSESYKGLANASQELRQLKSKLSDAQRQKDLYAYEIKEIDQAALLPDEDEKLQEEISLMQNAEKIFERINNVEEYLYGSYSAVDALGHAMNEISSVQSFNQELADFHETISDAYYEIDEMASDLRRFKESINFSEDELNEKLERQQLIEKLKRKYGGSIDAVFKYRENAASEMLKFENSDAYIAELEQSLSLYKQKFDTASERLLKLRTDAAHKLETSVTAELQDLNFSNAQFKVDISPASASESGNSKAEFLISANLGEAAKPLAKVASGGELSRVMLAMKRITGETDSIPTMIFDEIDTGISGASAGIVGKKLKSISDSHQIICITHLPQIAALGDYHYKIEKISDEISTQTTVTPLSPEQRIEELARLLSGTEITDAARAQAKELLA